MISGSTDGPEPFDFERSLEQAQDLTQRSDALLEVIQIGYAALEDIANVRGGAPSVRARQALTAAHLVAQERL